MGMAKCRECGHAVSTSAKACPNCGKPNPTESRLSGLAIVILAGIGAYAYMKFNETPPAPEPYRPPAAEVVAAKPKPAEPPPRPKLDVTRPMFTEANAAVCPISILMSRSAKHSADNIVSALNSFWNRSQKIADLGCEEVREGIPVYGGWMENTNENTVTIAFSREGPRVYFAMSRDIRN